MEVSEVQRSRVLSAARRVVFEYGYEGMSVARVTSRAGVSRRTFYDLFEDRDDCFLTLFGQAVEAARDRVTPAYEEGSSWASRVRAAMGELVGLLDEQPALGRVLLVDALRAGPRVLGYRAEVLERLSAIVDRDGTAASTTKGFVPLTGEGVIGGVLGVLHSRLLQGDPAPLSGLLNQLTATIVLPYLGTSAARRELERPPLAQADEDPIAGTGPRRARDPLEGLEMRVTYRTLRVLGVIAAQPGASNRLVADGAGISDQGQVSKLLSRLERLGLLGNSAHGQPNGEPNSWQLTRRGREIHDATISQAPVEPGNAFFSADSHPVFEKEILHDRS
jgi:AcrR family transcriptional regulator